MSEIAYGYPMTGAFGYSHMTGGYAGGQAEYVRVPYADISPIVIPDGIEDDRVPFLSDILPTGWMAAENCAIESGDTIAVWGCGPVGLFAIQSAFLQGAERVIAIDHYVHRLELAKLLGAEVIDYEQVGVREALVEMTGGIGPDACIDAVGMESHGMALDNVVDQVKASAGLGTDRPHVLRQVIMACRKGGRVSIPGVYGGFADKFPVGALMEKGLTIKTGQTHVQRYSDRLLQMILDGEIDTTFLISHRLPLEEAAKAYKMFKEQQNEITKVVLKPYTPLDEAIADFQALGAIVEAVQCDLVTKPGDLSLPCSRMRGTEDSGVTVTCLMPGVTDTEAFEGADMMDAEVGTQENKADPAMRRQDRL